MQFVREIVHPALFAGKPLPQSTRGGAPVRLQAKEVKGNNPGKKLHSNFSRPDVRLRRLRAHNCRARNPLSPPEGQPSLLTGPSQVLRQETFQVQQL